MIICICKLDYKADNCAFDRYVVMVHIHHSIGDGVSLMRLILGALVDTPVLISTKLCPKRHPLVW